MSRASKWLVIATLALPSVALADEVAPGGERSAQVIVTDPNYPQQDPNYPQQDPNYQQQPYDPNYQQQGYQQPPPQEQVSPARAGRGLEYGGSLFVPIWLGNTGEYYAPGIGIDLRAGWELGRGLSIDGHLGFTYNGIRNRYAGTYSDNLQSAYLGVGLRYAFLNRSALVPFLQAGIQLNLFSYCEYSSCASSFDTVNFGAYGGGGLLVELNPNLSVDFGLNVMMILGNSPGDSFDGFEKNLQPFIGVTLYY